MSSSLLLLVKIVYNNIFDTASLNLVSSPITKLPSSFLNSLVPNFVNCSKALYNFNAWSLVYPLEQAADIT
jgi:hypothetical protein